MDKIWNAEGIRFIQYANSKWENIISICLGLNFYYKLLLSDSDNWTENTEVCETEILQRERQ